MGRSIADCEQDDLCINRFFQQVLDANPHAFSRGVFVHECSCPLASAAGPICNGSPRLLLDLTTEFAVAQRTLSSSCPAPSVRSLLCDPERVQRRRPRATRQSPCRTAGRNVRCRRQLVRRNRSDALLAPGPTHRTCVRNLGDHF